MRTTLLICALLVSTANAFGKKREDKQGAAGVRGDLENEDTMRVQHEANGGYGGGGAREYEMENMARHRAGELNTAELGMANMKHAMNDPSAMAEMAEMMKDPDNVREVQKMMADPSFQQQAKAMMDQMPNMKEMMSDPNLMAKVQNMMSACGPLSTLCHARWSDRLPFSTLVLVCRRGPGDHAKGAGYGAGDVRRWCWRRGGRRWDGRAHSASHGECRAQGTCGRVSTFCGDRLCGLRFGWARERDCTMGW